MLQALKTKILLSILAALVAIGGLLTYQNVQAKRQAEEAAKARAILEHQQKEATERKAHEEALRKQVEENKKKHSSLNVTKTKTWTTYVP